MWYALVHDEQLGPMPDTELAELHAQGVISDDTLVWTATMSDWRPVSEVAEIQVLLADPDLLDDEEEAEGATMMMAAGDSDWAAILGKGPAGPPVQLNSPIVNVERAPEPQAPTEILDPELLADSLLEPLSTPAPAGRNLLGPPLPGPPLPGPPLSGFSGPSRTGPLPPTPSMPVFEDDEPGEGSIIDRFPDAPPVQVPDDGALPDFSAPTDLGKPGGGGGSKLPLILILLLLLGGGGAAVWFFVIDAPADPTPDAAIAAQTDAPASAAPATVAVGSAAPETAADEADAGVDSDAMVIALADLEPESPASDTPASAASEAPGTDAAEPEAAPGTDAAPSTDAAPDSQAPESAAPATRAPRVAPRSVASRVKRVPPKAPATREKRKAPASGDLPVQLSRAHIVSVLQASGGQLRSCASLDEKVKEGTFSVNVVIKRTGVVHSAKVVTGRLRGSPAAKCIEGQVKRFRFGGFTGDPMRIQLPFKL